MGPMWMLSTLYNNGVFVFVSDLKKYIITGINHRSQRPQQKRENIWRHYLFEDKIIQICLKIDANIMIRYWQRNI